MKKSFDEKEHLDDSDEVLLIDNDVKSSQIISTILGIGNFKVTVVKNGLQALEKVFEEGKCFGYILMHIKKGFRTSQILKNQGVEIPMVFYSEENIRKPSQGLLHFPEAIYRISANSNIWGIRNK